MEKNIGVMPSLSIERAKFSKPFTHKTSMKLGEIVPIYVDEVLPGDTFSMNIASLIRMSTPIAPIMDDIVMEYFAFFTPNRLAWKNWKRFMGESNTAGYEETELLAPMDKCGVANLPGSLLDYFGIASTNNTIKFSSFLLRDYIKIYNRWFRNQNVEAPIFENDTDNGGDVTPYVVDGIEYHYQNVTGSGKSCVAKLMPFVAYKKPDYFTAALPFAQKGPAVTLPLGTYAPVITRDDIADLRTAENTPNLAWKNKTGDTWSDYTAFLGIGNSDLTGGPGTIAAKNTSGDDENLSFGDTPSDGFVVPANLWTDLKNATAATINAVRLGFQTQKLLERDALYGSRYAEILYGHFSVRSPDASLQDPEYLGRVKTYINVDQVLQTTGASGDDSQTLGTPGANSVTGVSGNLFTKSFTEHGILMVLAVARQKTHTYGQGISRAWTREKRFDYMWPEFVNAGFQEIKNKEIDATHSDLEGTFGFCERYLEYRVKPGQVSGILNPSRSSSLDYWTLADTFGDLPTLSKSFLKESRANIARALVTGIDGPDFICDFYFDVTAVRPLPMYGIPGLVDHH